MKTKAIYLTTYYLLSASPVFAADMAATSTTGGIELRYKDPGSNASLSVYQDISVDDQVSFADRSFLMDFEFGNSPGAFTVGISKVKGSFTAHGQTQRLPASGLKDQSFSLDRIDGDRAMQRNDSDTRLQVGLGEMIGANYPIGQALVDVLPILPEQVVTLGSTWEYTQDTRSLEGWAWVEGKLNSQHSVTAVDQLNGHTIVSVSSTAQASLADVEGGVEYIGDGKLGRNAHWKFDATAGRLISLSMEQETSGINVLPQGTFNIRQLTKVEYSTLH